MDADRLQNLTKNYLDRIAHVASDFIYVDVDAKIPLTQVHVMLEAIQYEHQKIKEKRDERPPETEREDKENKEDTVRRSQPEVRQPPVLLSKVLNENQHVVLLGGPGTGKSTTLNFIGLCFASRDQHWAEEYLNVKEAWVPIKLSLQAYSTEMADPDAQMLPMLAREPARRLQIDQATAKDLVQSWLDMGYLMILLDGLDETQQKRQAVMECIRHFVESPQGKSARVVLTSRQIGYTTPSGAFKEFTLKPLQKGEEVQNFLRGWLLALRPDWQDDLDDKTEDLMKDMEAQPALKRLMANPLILRMAAEQYAVHETIANTRAQLYKAYVEGEAWKRAMRRGAREEQQGDALAALEALAWEAQLGAPVNEEKAVDLLQAKHVNLAQSDAGAKELLTLVREKMGLVVYTSQTLVFSHITFREYFVAKRLQKAWTSSKRAKRLTWKFLRPRLHLSAWREPLLLFSSLLDNKEEIASFIQTIYSQAKSPYESTLHRDFILAASMIGENDVDLPELIKKFMKALCSRKRGAAAEEAFKKIGPRAIPFLIQVLEKNNDESYYAVLALGKIADRQALPALLRVFEKDGDRPPKSVILALGEIGDPQALPALLHAFNDENNKYLRGSIAQALGQIGDSQAVPALLHALNDEHTYSFMHRDIARALGQIGDPQTIPALIEASKKNPYDHYEFSDALINIGVDAIPALLAAFQDEKDNYLRGNIVRTLGQIGDPQAIPALINTLQDDDYVMRGTVVMALGEIGDPQAVSTLRHALTEDSAVRDVAFEALAKIGDPQVLPILLNTLQDENDYVRSLAARALGELGDPQAVPVLVHALQDEDDYMRASAARALGEIGNHQAVPALIHVLRDKYDGARDSAAYALGQIGASQAIEPLFKLFKRGFIYTIFSIVYKFRKATEFENILEAILTINDEYHYTRFAAAYALGQIVQRLHFSATPRDTRKQIKLLRRVAKALYRKNIISLPNILERLETLTAPQFDPLNPPPPPAWKTFMRQVVITAAIIIATTIIGLLTVLSGPINDAIKKNPAFNAWIAELSFGSLLGISAGAGILLATLYLISDRLKKK